MAYAPLGQGKANEMFRDLFMKIEFKKILVYLILNLMDKNEGFKSVRPSTSSNWKS